MMQDRSPLTIYLVLAAVVFTFTGCGGGGGGGGVTAAKTTGTLQVSITDSPAYRNFSSVHLTIDKVVVVPTGKEGMADDDPGLPVIAVFPGGTGVDILNLHFIPQILGTTAIPAGSYSQVRLILAPNGSTLNNYVTLASNPTVKLPLKTPSAQQSGLKIIGNFTVTAGGFNTIVLDFDPNEAIVFAGKSDNIILKPTGIRIIQVFNSLANAGAISGLIHTPVFNLHSSSTFKSWSSAIVSVVRNSSVVTAGVVFSNFSSPDVWKGPFSAFVPPGTSYKVFVSAFSDSNQKIPAPFQVYSSQSFTVTQGVDTPVPPSGIAYLKAQ